MDRIKKMQEEIRKNYKSLPDFLQDLNIITSNRLALSGQDLTIYEKRVLAYAMGLIQKKHRELEVEEFIDKTFTIHVSNFKKLFCIKEKDGRVYEYIQNACVNLLKRQTKVIDKIKNSIHIFNWVQSITYDLGQGRVRVKFSDEVAEHLTQLSENYTSYNAFISHNFKSIYTIRTFELLQTKKNFGNRLEIDFDHLRQALGIYTPSYTAPSFVKARVLEKVKTELNEKFDLGFTYHIIKNKTAVGRPYRVILTAKKNNDTLLEWLKEKPNEKIELDITPVEISSSRSRRKRIVTKYENVIEINKTEDE